ncbi:helix-hairpin-helix domain-containing protein [Rossellomorea aquimaris]|nr:helix-hairpin-helix domain-containing protein [Rossellomorea aquimaris]WRP05338.1 helix-hairpin-helix domain-containing protein [Rossellomorea aquimaris]
MQSLIEKYRTFLVILVICAIVLVAYIFKNASAAPVKEASFTSAPVKKEKEPEKLNIVEKVFVDVKGEVVKPGLYEVRQGDRLKFVIDRAGGFTPEADKKVINLAIKVSDEMMIYVPKVGEIETPRLAPSMPLTDSGKGRININTATQQEFETLPGIGPAKASTFIHYREEHGPFATIEEIQNISGVGEKTFEKLKEYIYVQ